MKDLNKGDIFVDIPFFPRDPIEEVEKEFSKAKLNDKIFLGASELFNEKKETYKFDVVRKADEKLASEILDKDYLFPEGDREFNQLARNLCFGSKDIETEFGKHILTIQTIGATGAIRLAFNFLKKFMKAKVYIPSPTWPLASLIAEEVELEVEEIDFFDAFKQDLKFDNLINTLSNANNGSILFMQDVANSPTGKDPSIDQWHQIIKIVKEKDIRVFLDSAFQGYASGDLETDSEVVKMFLKADVQFFVAQTFSKNLGLYGERIGCLHVVCKSADDVERVKSQFEHRIRCLWLAPNLYGERLVKTILQDKELFSQWKQEFAGQAKRLKECRRLLRDSLKKIGAKGNWDSLTDHCGLYVLLPMNENQVNELKNKFNLYTIKNGRINISAINRNDVDRVARAIKEVMESESMM